MKRAGPIIAFLLLGACAALPKPVPVTANSESPVLGVPGRTGANPTLWIGGIGPRQPGLASNAFVATTSPSGGLALHDLQGGALGRFAGPPLSDIDVARLPLETSSAALIGGLHLAGRTTRIVLTRIDLGGTETPRAWGEVRTDLGRPVGFCMRQWQGEMYAVAVDRRGEVRQFRVREGADGAAVAEDVGRFRLRDVGAGCAISPATGDLFVSHRRGGFWRRNLAAVAGAPAARLDDPELSVAPRSQGLAIVMDIGRTHLISLDHDRRAFSVWGLARDELTWMGRIAVRDGPEGVLVQRLSGLDGIGADVGPFNGGLIVVQDQTSPGGANLKFVSWPDVKAALGL